MPAGAACPRRCCTKEKKGLSPWVNLRYGSIQASSSATLNRKEMRLFCREKKEGEAFMAVVKRNRVLRHLSLHPAPAFTYIPVQPHLIR